MRTKARPTSEFEDERLFMLEVELATDPRRRMREQAARREARIMSLLAPVATLLSLYDLTLLARSSGH